VPPQSESESQAPAQGAAGPRRAEARARVAYESQRRARLGMPAVAGGVIYLLGGVTVSATLRSLPTVGAVQGIVPALHGEANPPVSPGAPEVRFVDTHAFGLVAGNVMQALGIVLVLVVLLFLLDAIRFRRPETSAATRPLLLGGASVLALVSVVHPVAQVVNAHDFVTGHDFTADAVNRALTQSSAIELTQYLGLLAGLALAAGMIIAMLGASRTGVLPRWMTYLGIFAALLAFTPFGLALGLLGPLIPAFWMVAAGILLLGRWPGGDPPAWLAGEARPWPSQAQVRSERDAARAAARGERGGATAKGGGSTANGVAPEPVQPTPRGGSRRRRKRGSRR
jgi:hypothetical protein